MSPVELAPSNPYMLTLASPLLLAPGCALHDVTKEGAGALTTRTATLHTRHDSVPVFRATPAGVVFSRLPTVGIRTLLKEEGRHWQRSSLPVIVSLLGSTHEVADMTRVLENVEGIAGLLLSTEDDLEGVVLAARDATPRPLLAMLDHARDLVSQAQAAERSGVDALVVAAPPRAAAFVQDMIEGYLLGPAVFPLTLRAVRDVASAVSLPIVACGGITDGSLARAILAAGAAAVMIDAPRWGDLLAVSRIARSLASS